MFSIVIKVIEALGPRKENPDSTVPAASHVLSWEVRRRLKPEAVWTGGLLGRGHEMASGKPKLKKAPVRIWGRAGKVKQSQV